jgi:HPt (histidine-containing phosphotransfer) domain-containing protein
LVVSRTLYQIFVVEARELLRRLYDELDTLHPQSGEMARTAMSLAESAATLQLGPLRELGMSLVHALAPREVPLYVDDPEVRPLVRDVVAAIERMVDRLDAGDTPGEEEAADAAMLVAALRQLADGTA